jgi:5-(carboxyamino)imidazole ribonucleotide synthase
VSPPLPTGSWLGVLGGGQLGRMFAMAAHDLGYRVAVLDPDPDSPAGAASDLHIEAGFDDAAALARLADRCAAVTTEFENVPAASLEALARRVVTRPGAEAVAVTQDRIEEKRLAARIGLPVAPHAVIDDEAALAAAAGALFPGILKIARLGYDGKGQEHVASPDEGRAAFRALGGVRCVLEKKLALEAEISVVTTRSASGEVATFPVAHNVHRHGILHRCTAPAPVPTEVAHRARDAALAIAEALDYEGVLCVEFFLLAGGALVVNELAPRPHNSGHYTVDACLTSQFDQQVRVLAGLPLGSTRQHQPAVMLNLLGDLWFDPQGRRREPPWAEVLRHHPTARLHLYGKLEPRPGRKMGHVTVLGPTMDEASDEADAVCRCLGIAP